jgi:cob(I)alamin adenosyltransferase
MKIYTKTGDDGTTSLFNGKRVAKDDLRINAYGTIDELNAIIGTAISFETDPKLLSDLNNISFLLFKLGTDLATPTFPLPKFEVTRISANEVTYLETLIDEYTAQLPPLKNFILPSGTHSAALLHLARTVARRAERLIVVLQKNTDIGNYILQFINRLSDYLFTASRYSNFKSGKDETIIKF